VLFCEHDCSQTIGTEDRFPSGRARYFSRILAFSSGATSSTVGKVQDCPRPNRAFMNGAALLLTALVLVAQLKQALADRQRLDGTPLCFKYRHTAYYSTHV
jgi:hypothetical protein